MLGRDARDHYVSACCEQHAQGSFDGTDRVFLQPAALQMSQVVIDLHRERARRGAEGKGVRVAGARLPCADASAAFDGASDDLCGALSRCTAVDNHLPDLHAADADVGQDEDSFGGGRVGLNRFKYFVAHAGLLGTMETFIVDGSRSSTALQKFLLTPRLAKTDGISGVRLGKYSLDVAAMEWLKNRCFYSPGHNACITGISVLFKECLRARSLV